MARPDPCPCGDPLPPIRVLGRTADLLTLPAAHGPVTITSLTLSALLGTIPGIELFQTIQTAPAALHVRLRATAGADAERLWQAVHASISGLLAVHGLSHIDVERAAQAPEPAAGGKYRLIQPLKNHPTP